MGLEKESKQIFDTAIVVTDRTVLDDQIAGTLRAFAQMSNVLGHANDSSDLRSFLTSGKKIVITTVQKFPFILEEIGSSHRNRTFAILIDEAHSSQSGETAAKMNRALSAEGEADEDESYEDQVNRVMESRKMLPNASYFAFTATPKAKTLETFGTPTEEGGQTKRRAFHQYTMKQAIDEGFILDVLGNYTPVSCYYSLTKTIEEDPEFDVSKANKKLRRYVESHDHAVREKLSIFLNFLIPKLPTPIEPDLSAGILKALDMESYRAEAQATIKIAIADENAEIEPAPNSAGGRAPEPEMNRLSQIIRSFNERFGNFPGKTAEETQAAVEEISAKVDEDKRYKNARKNSDKQNSRIEMESALQRAMLGKMVNETELFKKYQDDPGFKSGLAELIFSLTYNRQAGESPNP